MLYLAGITLARRTAFSLPEVTGVYLGNTQVSDQRNVPPNQQKNLKYLRTQTFISALEQLPMRIRRNLKLTFDKLSNYAKSLGGTPKEFSVWLGTYNSVPCRYDFDRHVLTDIHTPILKEMGLNQRINNSYLFYGDTEKLYDQYDRQEIALAGIACPEAQLIFTPDSYGRFHAKRLAETDFKTAILLTFWETYCLVPITVLLINSAFYLVPILFTHSDEQQFILPLYISSSEPFKVADKNAICQSAFIHRYDTQHDFEVTLCKQYVGHLAYDLSNSSKLHYPSVENNEPLKPYDLTFDRIVYINEVYQSDGSDSLLVYNGLINLKQTLKPKSSVKTTRKRK